MLHLQDGIGILSFKFNLATGKFDQVTRASDIAFLETLTSRFEGTG